MNKAEETVDQFKKGLACSQAVLVAYSESLGLESKTALKIASGFAGGMRLGETCGAVIGAIMVLGLKFCQEGSDSIENRKPVYQQVTNFLTAFKEKHQSILCKSLLGCDISSSNGYQYAQENDLFKRFCPNFVQDAATIIDKLLTET